MKRTLGGAYLHGSTGEASDITKGGHELGVVPEEVHGGGAERERGQLVGHLTELAAQVSESQDDADPHDVLADTEVEAEDGDGNEEGHIHGAPLVDEEDGGENREVAHEGGAGVEVALADEGGKEGGGTMARFNLSWVLGGEATGDGKVPDWANP